MQKCYYDEETDTGDRKCGIDGSTVSNAHLILDQVAMQWSIGIK